MKFKLSTGILTAFIAFGIFSSSVEARPRLHKNYNVSRIDYKKSSHRHGAYRLGRKHHRSGAVSARAYSTSPETKARVEAIIRASAPGYGVPAWFALRIAQVESGFNPSIRGQAGEYGVYQLKCQTARGLGLAGDCSRLLDPYTNVQYGLRHLSIAMKLSGGNLRLAASKHNGGLGTKKIRHRYVQLVF